MLSLSSVKNNPFDSGEAQRAVSDYLSRGWRLIPLGATRTPLVRWGEFTAEPQSFSQVWRALGDRRCAGVGVALGPSNLVCRDFDTLESYAAFQVRYPVEAAMLPTARTARGFHVYARCDTATKTTVIPDGEFRAGRSYVVLPPSRHESGITYRWIIPLPDGGLPIVGADFLMGRRINWAAELGLAASDTDTPTTLHTKPPKTINIVTSLNCHKKNDALNCHKKTDAESSDIWLGNLPQKFGQRNRCLLGLVRSLKAHPRYADAELESLRDGLYRWHTAALPTMRQKDFAVNFAQFASAWRLYRGDKSGIGIVIAAARKMPALLPDAELSLLGSTCRILAAKNRGCFALSCRLAARIIGSQHPQTGQRAIEDLIALKIIRLVKRGRKNPSPGTPPNKYKWMGPPAPATPPDGPPIEEEEQLAAAELARQAELAAIDNAEAESEGWI